MHCNKLWELKRSKMWEKRICEMLSVKVIPLHQMLWPLQIIPVQWRDRSLRIFENYCRLNEITLIDSYHMAEKEKMGTTWENGWLFWHQTPAVVPGIWKFPAMKGQKASLLVMNSLQLFVHILFKRNGALIFRYRVIGVEYFLVM